MSFATCYDSAWQHPGLAWLGTLAVFLWATLQRSWHGAPRAVPAQCPRSRSRATLLWTLQLVVFLDALCTGALSPIPAPSAWATASAVVFVILGDARFFFVLTDPALSSWGLRLRILRAVLISGAVSVAAYAVKQAFPTQLASSRHLFLTYELMMFVACLFLMGLIWRRPDGPRTACQRRLLGFEVAQYGLWALADLVILSAHRWSDLGFALRILPNALYYVAFVPFAVCLGTCNPVEDCVSERTALRKSAGRS